MVLKTISEIKTTDSYHLEQYAYSIWNDLANISEHSAIIPQSYIQDILNDINQLYPTVETPCSPEVKMFLQSFIAENNVSYNLYPDWFNFCVECLRVFEFTVNGNRHRVYIANNEVDAFMDSLMSIATQDTPYVSTQALLQLDSYKNLRPYLISLGLLTPEEQDVSNLVIPPPSNPTKDNTARFSSAVWYEEIQKKNILVAGQGGIGSWVSLLLGRMNPKSMILYDDDSVETVNMAGQFYSTDDIGKHKVVAMFDALEKYSDYHTINAIHERFTSDSHPMDIMISGFDNMEARKTFFHVWKKHVLSKPQEERKHCLYIDGRF